MSPTAADLLRSAMIRNRFNQKELAAAIGVTGTAVTEWLRYGRQPQPRYAARIAELAGVELSYALRVMGHIDRDFAQETPPEVLPETLLATLRELSPGELEVVHETARGLLRVREERRSRARPRAARPPGGSP